MKRSDTGRLGIVARQGKREIRKSRELTVERRNGEAKRQSRQIDPRLKDVKGEAV